MMSNHIGKTDALLVIWLVSILIGSVICPYLDDVDEDDEGNDPLVYLGMATKLPKSFAKFAKFTDPDLIWKKYHNILFEYPQDIPIAQTLEILKKINDAKKWAKNCPIDGPLFLSLSKIDPKRCTVHELREYSAYADDAKDYPAIRRYIAHFAKKQFEYCAKMFMKDAHGTYSPLESREFPNLAAMRSLLDKSNGPVKWWRGTIRNSGFEDLIGKYLYDIGARLISRKPHATESEIIQIREASRKVLSDDCEEFASKEMKDLRNRYLELSCIGIVSPFLEARISRSKNLEFFKNMEICTFVDEKGQSLDFKEVCLHYKASKEEFEEVPESDEDARVYRIRG